MPMYRLFYLWHNHKLFLYYILTIYIPSTFLHIMFMYMYMYNMNQFEINHSFWNTNKKLLNRFWSKCHFDDKLTIDDRRRFTGIDLNGILKIPLLYVTEEQDNKWVYWCILAYLDSTCLDNYYLVYITWILK